ncbi:unnamed protein product, partial [Symbiodinium sp. KB8]
RARSKQASIPAVQSYWADSMWKLCADMRRGLTFGEATDRIMKDTGAWNEHVIAHAAAAARQRPAPPTKESMGPTGPPRPMVKSPGKAGRGAGGPRRRPTAQTTTKGDGRDGQQQPPKGQTKGGGRDDTGSWKDHGGRGGHQQKDWNAQAAQAYPTESPTATRSSCCPFSTVSARPPAGLGPRGQTGGHVRLGDGSGGQAVAKAQLPGLNDDDPATDVIEKDFSRVTDGPGHHGDRGGLFLQTVEFMSEVRRLVAPRRFGFIFENVEMATADAEQITEALGAAPLWVDAADFGWVGRPRLWWLSADWARMTLDPET